MSNAPDLPVGAKVRDYWWTVFFTDPLALPVVRFLVPRKGITPDQISVVAILLGVAVGPLFAMGERVWFLAGGLLFYLAFFVDCIDGKLARARAISSDRGAELDRVGDGARRASASLGLIVGMYRYDELSDNAWLWAAAYVVAAYFFWEMSGVEQPISKTTRAEEAPGRWAAALARRRLLPTPGMPDVQAVVFILGPITGLLVPALVVGLAMVGAGALINIARRVR